MATKTELAIIHAGGITSLAKLIGISPPAVFRWKKNNRIPADKVLAVEKAISKAVTRYELRPDIYPQES